jgi:hypothetical protein
MNDVPAILVECGETPKKEVDIIDLIYYLCKNYQSICVHVCVISFAYNLIPLT